MTSEMKHPRCQEDQCSLEVKQFLTNFDRNIAKKSDVRGLKKLEDENEIVRIDRGKKRLRWLMNMTLPRLSMQKMFYEVMNEPDASDC